MRWTSWLPRSRQPRLCVLGLDVGPEFCSLVVLTGSPTHPDTVCCAERLSLPEAWVVQGEVLQSFELGHWLQAYLEAGDYQPEAVYVGLDDACISHHTVTLAEGLSEDDVAFQLLAEAQSVLPECAADISIDFGLDAEPAPAGDQRYWVQAAPRARVDALQRVARAANLKVQVVEPRHDAARRTQLSEALAQLPQVSAALAWQCDEAFGLALRAWRDEGVNFLPYRAVSKHLLRRAWVLGVAVCAMGGAFLAAGFALVMSSAAESKHWQMGDVVASTQAYDASQKNHAQAKAAQQRRAEQARWLKARQDLQSQSLQWSRVLSQAANGVWVASVKQQGTRWTVQGEALSATHAQQLVAQLTALDIWAQAPALPQLQLQITSVVSTTGLPVWQFRIEADLKVGV